MSQRKNKDICLIALWQHLWTQSCLIFPCPTRIKSYVALADTRVLCKFTGTKTDFLDSIYYSLNHSDPVQQEKFCMLISYSIYRTWYAPSFSNGTQKNQELLVIILWVTSLMMRTDRSLAHICADTVVYRLQDNSLVNASLTCVTDI